MVRAQSMKWVLVICTSLETSDYRNNTVSCSKPNTLTPNCRTEQDMVTAIVDLAQYGKFFTLASALCACQHTFPNMSCHRREGSGCMEHPIKQEINHPKGEFTSFVLCIASNIYLYVQMKLLGNKCWSLSDKDPGQTEALLMDSNKKKRDMATVHL